MGTILYDSFGYPTRSSGGGKLYDATRVNSTVRPSWETVLEPIHKTVGYQDWRILTSAGRRLVSNYPILQGAMHAKAMHSVGRAWSPVFMGENQAWGDEAIAWLTDEWFPICDVEGPNFDWKTSLFLDSVAVDGDGDYGVIFTQTARGYPKLQHIACDRIGMRNFSAKLVGPNDAWSSVDNRDGTFSKIKGVYEGYRIELGVIFSSYGEPIAFRVLGSTPEEDQDISSNDMQFSFDPRQRGQKRGLNAFAEGIEFLASSFEAHSGEMRALIASSFLNLIEYNLDGRGDPTDEGQGGEKSNLETKLQTWEKGMIKYFTAGSGQKIEIPVSNRPSTQWDSFNDRIIRICLSPVWPYSLIWKPDQMNGTQERSAIEQARALITDRQDLLFPKAKRQIGWATSKAVNQGILPPYTGRDGAKGGQFKFGFEMPPEFNIDHGREDQQWRANYLLGAATKTEYLAKNGKRGFKAHQDLREKEVRDTIRRVKAISVEEEIPFETALALYEQRNASGSALGLGGQALVQPEEPTTTNTPGEE